jgi:iron complex transport system ATP-binding protein
LDEPTVHLDLQHQENLMEIIRSLAHRDNLAVLIALHDLNLAARYADRVALLVAGEVKAVGTARQVLTSEILSAAYHLPVQVIPHPFADVPLVLPGSQ